MKYVIWILENKISQWEANIAMRHRHIKIQPRKEKYFLSQIKKAESKIKEIKQAIVILELELQA